MRQAIVTVRDENGSTFGVEDLVETFHAADIVDIEVLSCEGPRVVVRVTLEETVDESRLADLPAVVWHERAGTASGAVDYLVEFDVRDADVGVGFCTDDLLHCRAIDVAPEGFTFDLAGPQEAIGAAIEDYRETGADVDLQTLRDYRRPERPLDALTARQREVVEAAFEAGYFEVPRRASTDDVADEVDLDPSTVTEHLQRAERNLFSTILANPA